MLNYSNNQAINFYINYRFNKSGDKPRVTSSLNKAKRNEEWKTILDLRTLDEETYKVRNIISIHFDICLQTKISIPSHHCYEWSYFNSLQLDITHNLYNYNRIRQFFVRQGFSYFPLTVFGGTKDVQKKNVRDNSNKKQTYTNQFACQKHEIQTPLPL